MASTTSKAIIICIIFTILLQLFITTPAFAATVGVPNIGCSRIRDKPCYPLKPPPKKCNYYHVPGCPPATPNTDVARPNIKKHN
ncbi:hypothetical protein J5N97_006435 [Dioscorea zingiberensis]|uniref:Uncharacterized protein n=1 Tax=Dioscorea zingiberensis TaxID=325984 RepID=A0A9D5DAV5_9LILI|nr:hypothetical protein J5N97_006435 [Dioscorea zingiberensis]